MFRGTGLNLRAALCLKAEREEQRTAAIIANCLQPGATSYFLPRRGFSCKDHRTLQAFGLLIAARSKFCLRPERNDLARRH